MTSAPSSAVIAGYARTPFHFAKKGRLVGVRPDDLAATSVKGLLERTKVNPADIEDLILGCSYPEGEQGHNMARIVVFLAGLPNTVAGTTVNRFCGSAMTAIHIAAGQIAIGAGEVFVCGGVLPRGLFQDGRDGRGGGRALCGLARGAGGALGRVAPKGRACAGAGPAAR